MWMDLILALVALLPLLSKKQARPQNSARAGD
jgi:hypothetical protein